MLLSILYYLSGGISLEMSLFFVPLHTNSRGCPKDARDYGAGSARPPFD